MLYWANINNVKVGPLEPEQLASYGLTPDTYVWREGWQQWCKAKFVDELQPWLYRQYGNSCGYAGGSATQYWHFDNRAAGQEHRPPMPSTYLPWSLIVTLACCMPLGIVAIIYSSMVESRYAAGNYDGALSASSRAKGWCIAGAILGALKYLWMIFYFMIAICRVKPY